MSNENEWRQRKKTAGKSIKRPSMWGEDDEMEKAIAQPRKVPRAHREVWGSGVPQGNADQVRLIKTGKQKACTSRK